MFNAFRRWWHAYPETGLDLWYQMEDKSGYCPKNVVRKIPRNDYNWYLQKRNLGCEYNSLIRGVYYKRLLPIIDADSEVCMINASLWLKENKIGHAIIASSADKYWMIIDKPCEKWKHVKQYMDVPGQDNQYLNVSKYFKSCYLRSEMKDDYFMPVIIEKSNSELVDGFCEDIIKHFSLRSIRWLWRTEMYKKGNVDLSNPDTEDDFTLDDILQGAV